MPDDDRHVGPRWYTVWWATALALVTFICSVQFWWAAVQVQVKPANSCASALNSICVNAIRDLFSVVPKADEPVILTSWILAVLVVLLTWLAFLVHIIRGHLEIERLAKQREDIARAEAAGMENDVGTNDGENNDRARVSADPPAGYWPWFLQKTHILAELYETKKGLWLFCLLPFGAFFAAMIQHGQRDAAVFALAIAAIYVAAEHYSALEQHKELVTDQHKVLTTIRSELSTKVADIANALGEQNGHRKINVAYIGALSEKSGCLPPEQMKGRDIFSIYRFFDIDREWWQSSAASTWEFYWKSPGTLYESLRIGQRAQILLVAPVKFSLGVHSAEDKAAQFHNIIGLMWSCIVFWKLKIDLITKGHKADSISHVIKIADTSLWIHVVDSDVFQILGDTRDDLRVRKLTLDMPRLAGPLAQWAKREIALSIAPRGPTAEEYVCSCLANTREQLAVEGTQKINPDHNDSLLKNLGLDAWIEQKMCPAGIGEQLLREKCVALVNDFLAYIASLQNGGVPTLDGKFEGRISHLAIEVE
jgi:hypothetical protein